MPRAVACFRAVGFQVVAYPVDYRTKTDQSWRVINKSAADGLEDFDIAVHEWVGLVAYRLAGKTAEILPSPLPAS
jgi:uncharacterized SAM-binding protein YcdF (DUF218 family)